jgi:hypothetical protein
MEISVIEAFLLNRMWPTKINQQTPILTILRQK